MSYLITSDQLRVLHEFAEALDRLALVGEQLAMPAAYHLRQIDRELPDIALRIKALCITIQGQDEREAHE